MRDTENFSQGLDWIVENTEKQKNIFVDVLKKYLKKNTYKNN